MEWYTILSYAVGIAGAILGVVFLTKWGQAVSLLKEIGEAFTKTSEVLEDKKLTKDEAVEMLKEWQDVINSIKNLLPKG